MARVEDAPVGGLPDDRNAAALLKRLEWTVLRRLDGLLQGNYRTLMRGAGLDLADLREYQHHDDVRHIDWNVTARLQQPYVRQFTRHGNRVGALLYGTEVDTVLPARGGRPHVLELVHRMAARPAEAAAGATDLGKLLA